MTLRVGMANEAFYRVVRRDGRSKSKASRSEEMCDGIWKTAELRRALKARARRRHARELRDRARHAGPGPADADRSTPAASPADGRAPLVLLGIDDVTERRQAEALTLDAETLRRSTGGRTSSSASSPTSSAIRWRRCASRWRFCGAPATTTDRRRKARQVLDRQLTHMVRIVDDLLDVSRITQGKVELRREVVDLKNVVSAAVELCQPSSMPPGRTSRSRCPTSP